MFDIKKLRDKLDRIEEDALFEQEFFEAEELNMLLLEGSPLIRQFGNSPAGISLAKYLHNKYKVSDQAVLVPYTHDTGNLDLKRFKRHYDNFTVLVGPNGWAAFKPNEESIRHRLENDPIYNPSEDRKIEYIGVFSVEDGDKVYEIELKSTRGGAYSKREKKEAKKASIADLLKEVIGFKKLKVFRLMTRDDPEMAELDASKSTYDSGTEFPEPDFVGQEFLRVDYKPNRLYKWNGRVWEVVAGAAPPDPGSSGTSVQRSKISARADTPDVDKILDEVTKRFVPVVRSLCQKIYAREYVRKEPNRDKRRAFSDAMDTIQNRSNLKDLFDVLFTDDEFLRKISSNISAYRSKNPTERATDSDIAIKIAASPTDSRSIVKPMISTLRTLIYNRGKEAADLVV